MSGNYIFLITGIMTIWNYRRQLSHFYDVEKVS